MPEPDEKDLEHGWEAVPLPVPPSIDRFSSWIWPEGERAERLKRLQEQRLKVVMRSAWSLIVLVPVPILLVLGQFSWHWAFIWELFLSFIPGLAISRAWEKPVADEDLLLKEFGVIDHDCCLVGIKIVQGSAVTGRDRGILWLEPAGRLMFSGHACSFAISANDVAFVFDKRRDRSQGEIQLLMLGPAGNIVISVSRLRAGKEAQAQLMDLLYLFIKNKYPWLVGQLPPMDLGPGADSEKGIKCQLFYSVLALVGAIAINFGVFLYGVVWSLHFIIQRVRALLSLRKIRHAGVRTEAESETRYA